MNADANAGFILAAIGQTTGWQKKNAAKLSVSNIYVQKGFSV
jgi:hypothetical protein